MKRRSDEYEKLLAQDQARVLEAARGFAAEAFGRLRTTTGLDPHEGHSRPSLRITFGSHYGCSGVVDPPPDFRALIRSQGGGMDARSLVDLYYNSQHPNDDHCADTLGTYRMDRYHGAQITLRWDTLRLAAKAWAEKSGRNPEEAREALTRYVYLHELGHYFTHWGLAGPELNCTEKRWREHYFNYKSDGEIALREGLTELACETALKQTRGGSWSSTREARKWQNRKLTGTLRERYVDSTKRLRELYQGPLSPPSANFWCNRDDYSLYCWKLYMTGLKCSREEARARNHRPLEEHPKIKEAQKQHTKTHGVTLSDL